MLTNILSQLTCLGCLFFDSFFLRANPSLRYPLLRASSLSYFFSAPTLLEGVPPLDQFFDSCSRSPHNAFGMCRFIPQHRQHGRTSKLNSFPHPAPTGNFSGPLEAVCVLDETRPFGIARCLFEGLDLAFPNCSRIAVGSFGVATLLLQSLAAGFLILQLVPRRGSIGSTLAVPKGTITTCKRHCFPQLVSYLAQHRLHLISRLATQFLCKI